ncbi:MAG: four helix bundle protein [Pirellulales bacterium]|nr:four helix bundle protein [Pirellulales bacterium]
MKPDVNNFRDLKVWQLGMQLTEDVYKLSHQFPKSERQTEHLVQWG